MAAMKSLAAEPRMRGRFVAVRQEDLAAHQATTMCAVRNALGVHRLGSKFQPLLDVDRRGAAEHGGAAADADREALCAIYTGLDWELEGHFGYREEQERCSICAGGDVR